jgi:hypothetical protein
MCVNFCDFDLFDKVRVVGKRYNYPARDILADCYYPITISLPLPLPSREGRYKLDEVYMV